MRLSSSRASNPPDMPVTGSTWGVSVKGNSSGMMKQMSLEGLTEAQVELAAHRPRDVGDDAVQRHSARLVLVHTRVEHVAQEPAALGSAERVSVVEQAGCRVARRGVLVLQERDGVAHRREPQPDHAAEG